MITITATMVKELRDRTNAAIMACKEALQKANGDLKKAINILHKTGKIKAAKWADKSTSEGIIVIAVSPNQKKAFMTEVNSETDFVARDINFIRFAEDVAKLGLKESIKDVVSLSALSMHSHASLTIEDARKELVNKIGENIQIRRVALLSLEDGVVGYYCHGGRIGVLVTLNTKKSDLAKDIAMHIAAFQPQAIRADQVPIEFLEKERRNLLVQAKESGKPGNIIEKIVVGRLKKLLKEVSLEGQPFLKDSEISVGDLLKSEKVKVFEFVRFEVGEGKKGMQDFSNKVMMQVQGNH